MIRWLAEIVDIQGFPPRWSCGPVWQQQPWWGWTHIAADVATWGAYVAIPLVILRLVRHRQDIPFSRVFWLFAVFIFACGTGHLLDAMIFWWPAYRLSALLKVTTAVVSWATVICLVSVIPRALALRTPRELEREVEERTQQLQQMADRLQEEVDERRRVSANWHSSQEQLQLALEAGGMGAWDWNLDTNRVCLNPTEMELLGIGEPDGKINAPDFFELVHPDDRDSVSHAIDEAMRLHHSYDHEFRIRLPSGEIRWLGGRGEVIHDSAGTPVRMMGVHFDISRRKRDEEILRQKTRAIEFATNGITIADALQPDCPLVFVNPAFEELTGYSAAESVGRNCRFLQGPDTDREAVREVRLAIQEGRECAVTIRNYRKDGTPFWNDLRIAPIFDEHNHVTHFVGIQSDVTERIDAEYELFQAREAAEAANRAKSRFLASMSHEIRTPLTAVLGCADILCRRIEAGADRELAEVIRNQGESLLQLLNDVLDLSKIEAGRIELRYEWCELRPLIDEIRKLVEPMAAEKGISLRAEVASSLPTLVQLDPLRVRQILLNLLSNSVKFTDEGLVELLVEPDPSLSAEQLHIVVRDTGVGIPEDQVADLFQEFSQAENQRSVRGTGLGLAIVRRLVELHGGQIVVESTVGHGTTFRIRLPMPGGSADQRVARSAASTNPELARPGSRLPCRLLIAEDTRSLQFMLRHLLQHEVTSITIVGNGSEAIEAVHRATAENCPFDMVLMDMQMPILDGYETTQRLRAEGFTEPIIALTAGAMEGERQKCLAIGCTDYIPKPLDREHLLRTLRKYSFPGVDDQSLDPVS